MVKELAIFFAIGFLLVSLFASAVFGIGLLLRLLPFILIVTGIAVGAWANTTTTSKE